MVVKTQERHPGHRGAIGLHVGPENVQQFFPPNQLQIELELDHLQITCSLEPSFWQDRPEIHDTRLSSWLESKRNSGKLASNGSAMAMIPNGRFAFRLQIAQGAAIESTDFSLIAPAVPAYFSPTISPSALLDRRKRNIGNAMGHKPDRRRVARLKSDERATTSASH